MGNLLKIFNKNDYEEIKSWYLKRNLEVIRLDCLPETGFIVPNICAGFLYKTNGKMGLIENFISNPDIEGKYRNEALNLISEALLKEAKDSGILYIISTTNKDSILDRSLSFGFKDIGIYHVVCKWL